MSNAILESSEVLEVTENREPPSPFPGECRPPSVPWYRTRIDPKELKELHERSDLLGGLQTLAYLGWLTATGLTAFWAAGRLPFWEAVAIIFLHGLGFAFLINAVHELGHGTVFKTKFLNELFLRIFSFMGWINFEKFGASHFRHHRYTLYPPDDSEVVLPLKVMARDFFLNGFVNLQGFKYVMKDTIRMARGRLEGEWENTLFPENSPERRLPINWARALLAGHGLILLVSLYFNLWLIPLLVTLAPFYGSWLFFLCNNTQHIGLQDKVPDFRLNSRTFTLNPLVQFLYWHMNYHIEHHMYAAVPCYRLGRLHRLIKHDLPPTPHGLIATWRKIAAIQKIQKTNPAYQHVALCPNLLKGVSGN